VIFAWQYSKKEELMMEGHQYNNKNELSTGYLFEDKQGNQA